MVTAVRTETREQMLRRLAEKARVEGVKLSRDERDGRHYASSVSNPGHMYYLTAVSCTCPGFASHGRCKHHSALLVALGWVAEDSTPEPEIADAISDAHFTDVNSVSTNLQTEEPTACASCNGSGSTSSTELYRGQRVEIFVPCHRCHGIGQDQVAA